MRRLGDDRAAFGRGVLGKRGGERVNYVAADCAAVDRFVFGKRAVLDAEIGFGLFAGDRSAVLGGVLLELRIRHVNVYAADRAAVFARRIRDKRRFVDGQRIAGIQAEVGAAVSGAVFGERAGVKLPVPVDGAAVAGADFRPAAERLGGVLREDRFLGGHLTADRAAVVTGVALEKASDDGQRRIGVVDRAAVTVVACLVGRAVFDKGRMVNRDSTFVQLERAARNGRGVLRERAARDVEIDAVGVDRAAVHRFVAREIGVRNRERKRGGRFLRLVGVDRAAQTVCRGVIGEVRTGDRAGAAQRAAVGPRRIGGEGRVRDRECRPVTVDRAAVVGRAVAGERDTRDRQLVAHTVDRAAVAAFGLAVADRPVAAEGAARNREGAGIAHHRAAVHAAVVGKRAAGDRRRRVRRAGCGAGDVNRAGVGRRGVVLGKGAVGDHNPFAVDRVTGVDRAAVTGGARIAGEGAAVNRQRTAVGVDRAAVRRRVAGERRAVDGGIEVVDREARAVRLRGIVGEDAVVDRQHVPVGEGQVGRSGDRGALAGRVQIAERQAVERHAGALGDVEQRRFR